MKLPRKTKDFLYTIIGFIFVFVVCYLLSRQTTTIHLQPKIINLDVGINRPIPIPVPTPIKK